MGGKMKVTDKIRELRLKGVGFEDMAELDKRFIDKEEFKKKIQTKMMGYGLDFDRVDIRPKYKQHSRERYNELEQVLELLEE